MTGSRSTSSTRRSPAPSSRAGAPGIGPSSRTVFSGYVMTRRCLASEPPLTARPWAGSPATEDRRRLTPRFRLSDKGQILFFRTQGTGLMARTAALVAVIALALAGTSAAAEITGPVRVIDGDTLDMAGTRIRLWGIDAPENRQACEGRDGQTYECGRDSRAVMLPAPDIRRSASPNGSPRSIFLSWMSSKSLI
jgi:hypothetical protein